MSTATKTGPGRWVVFAESGSTIGHVERADGGFRASHRSGASQGDLPTGSDAVAWVAQAEEEMLAPGCMARPIAEMEAHPVVIYDGAAPEGLRSWKAWVCQREANGFDVVPFGPVWDFCQATDVGARLLTVAVLP